MNLIKRLGISSFALCLAAVLGLVALILTNVSVTAYFANADITTPVLLLVLGIVGSLIGIAVNFVPAKGAARKVVRLVADAVVILVAVAFMAAALVYIGHRAQGLGYIFVHDPQLDNIIGTPENTAVAGLTITTTIFMVICSVVTMVAAFLPDGKAEEVAA
ncbi:MAG: hypothetical protein K6F32_05555 [Bacilli bacterium]|nr:hypothetical protein [Bacilli bacterium]